MKHLLFVDDETNILAGLRRTMRPLREQWSMEYVSSGEEALKLLAGRHFEVVVSDIRMPGMDGVTLLDEVKKRYPATLRIVLSGYSDTEMTLELARVAHQFLTKPCDAETLRSTVNRAMTLCNLLSDQRLVNLVSKFESLPSLPSLYIEIMDELNSPQGTLANVGNIIARDVPMTAKMLQLVNSAFFGIPRHVSTPSQAATLLGIDIIRSLVLSAKIFSSFDQDLIKKVNIHRLWKHSLATAALAKQLSIHERQEKNARDQAFLGGMLHDIGKLVLAAGLPDESEKIAEVANAKQLRVWEAELEILCCTHAEIGGYLLGLWGLPTDIIESVTFHHRPDGAEGKGFTPLTAVHAANALLQERDEAKAGRATQLLDRDYLRRLGLDDHVAEWRKVQQALGDT